MSRVRDARGVTLVELTVAAAMLAGLGVAVLGLLSSQRREISHASHGLALHGHAIWALREAESYLDVVEFSRAPSGSVPVRIAGVPFDVTRITSVEPVVETTGLWRVQIELAWIDPAGARAPKSLKVSKLVVDRGVVVAVPPAPVPETNQEESR